MRKISENLCDPTVCRSFVLYKHDLLLVITQTVFTAVEYMTVLTEPSNQCRFVTSCWTLNIAKTFCQQRVWDNNTLQSLMYLGIPV